MPRISCVLPTKNRDDLIKNSVESIILQTEKDWELIVVDDHSSADDKTKETIESLGDQRIKYFKLSDENGTGIACARNFGNAMATSQIIAVMDSDDHSYPKRFEWSLDALKKDSCDIVYGDIDYWYPDENKIERYHSRQFNLEDFKKFDFIPHPASSYRKQIAIDFPYNSFYRRAEDYDFFARLYIHKFNFKYLKEVFLKYRKHSGSITIEKNELFNYPNKVRESRGWPLMS